MEIKDDLSDLRSKMVATRAKRLVAASFWNPTTVKTTDTVEDAFSMLIDNGYFSAPVVDGMANYQGFFDMMQVAIHCINIIDTMTFHEKRNSIYSRAIQTFRKANVENLRHRPRRIEVHPNCTLLHAFENMARYDQSQIAILGGFGDSSVQGVLTQSMIIDWLVDNLEGFSFVDLPIWKVRPFNLVVTINDSQPAIDAFRLMEDHHLSGLAVVNDLGKVTDAISVRDIRAIGHKTQKFHLLLDSVKALKAEVKENFPEAPWTVMQCQRTSTIKEILRTMNDDQIHRVFVVDVTGRPVDIITQTDILRYIFKQICPNPSLSGQGAWRRK